MMQSQNYGLQQLTKHEGSMCIQKPWKERMKDHLKPRQYILSPNPKVAPLNPNPSCHQTLTLAAAKP
jgi:hypothetical protein